MKWVIACKVEGGVTGTRESVVKNRGEVMLFDDINSARQCADHLSNEANNVYATATFTYKPVGLPEGVNIMRTSI